jgi:hypothetical protein
VNRRDHEQTTTPEQQPGLQGESGACRDQGRAGAAGTAELAGPVHANQITSWRTQLLEGAAEVSGGDSKAEAHANLFASFANGMARDHASVRAAITEYPSLPRHRAHPASPAGATYYATIDNPDMAA